MRKLNCLIADDELLAREVIKNHIDKLENLNLVGSCKSGVEVYTFLKSQTVDLLFLDIQMPHLTGIDLLKILKCPSGVILTTAYREFALESYDLNVIDYLLKPISFERFLIAVDKYIRRIDSTSTVFINKQPVLQKTSELDFIYIRSNNKMIRVLIKDIIYLEGLKGVVMVHTTETSLITYQSLTYFNEKLPDHLFIRVHRSYIISITHVTAYTSAHIELDKIIIPVGKSFAADILQKLKISEFMTP